MNGPLSLEVKRSESLSEFSDPFIPEAITSIWFHIRRGLLSFNRGEVSYTATVRFEHKNTKGEHEIQAKDFDELVLKTKAFLEELR